MKKFLVAFSVLALSGAAATAMTIEEVDSDGDGGLSLSEVQAAQPEITEEMFTEADTDADGMLNAEEVAAAQEAGLLPAES
ncbi:MAG: hypothetical protein ACU0DK_11120 [Pseudooceanicola sp.]